MEIAVVVDVVAAADAEALVAIVAFAAAVAVVVAAADDEVVGVPFGAAAVPVGITVVPSNSGAVDQMKPIAAV